MDMDIEKITPKHEDMIIIRENEERYEYLKKLKSLLISELDFQSDLASRAFHELESAIKKNDERKTWYSIQMFMFTSRCIWEVLEKIKKLSEGYSEQLKTEDLRSLSKIYPYLRLQEDEFSKNFGDDLERWILDPKNNRIIENHIFQKRSGVDLDLKQVLRHFDPETYELTFKNKTYDLKEHHDEIQEIKRHIENIYQENFWNV